MSSLAYLRLLVLVFVASGGLTPLLHPTATISLTGTAGEISQSQAVAPSSTSNQEQDFVKIGQLTLKGQTGVPAKELGNIIAVVKQIPYDKSRWRDEVQNRIRQEWQRRGYFRVSVQHASVENSPAPGMVSGVGASFVVKAKSAYRTKGFEEFYAIPSFELDDKAGLIKCIVQVDEGKNVQHLH